MPRARARTPRPASKVIASVKAFFGQRWVTTGDGGGRGEEVGEDGAGGEGEGGEGVTEARSVCARKRGRWRAWEKMWAAGGRKGDERKAVEERIFDKAKVQASWERQQIAWRRGRVRCGERA